MLSTAAAALERNTYDCLLVDLDMPGLNGIQVIERAREAEHAGRTRVRVERADAGDEVGAVREIEVVNARRDARLDEAVAVSLKRPARVDDRKDDRFGHPADLHG